MTARPDAEGAKPPDDSSVVRIEHLSIYHLPTVASIPDEPTVVLPETRLDAATAISGLARPSVTAFLTTDVDRHVVNLDRSAALANVLFDNGLAATEDGPTISMAIEQVRVLRRARYNGGVFLVARTAGSIAPVPTTSALAISVTATHTLVVGGRGAPLFVAIRASAERNELKLLASLGLAAIPTLTHTHAGRATFILDGSRVEYRMWNGGSAVGTVSTGLAAKSAERARVDATRLLAQPGFVEFLTPLGRSMMSDLDPTVDFLTVFTALEQYVKSRTSTGKLTPRFKSLAESAVPALDPVGDLSEFASLYKIRNNLAHEGLLLRDRGPADRVRRLFSKCLLAEAG